MKEAGMFRVTSNMGVRRWDTGKHDDDDETKNAKHLFRGLRAGAAERRNEAKPLPREAKDVLNTNQSS